MKKFIIGSYVRAGDIIIKVDLIEYNKLICIELGESIYINDAEQWYPKDGEWCWFWDEKTKDKPILRRSGGYTDKYGDRVYYSDKSSYLNCEPFLGLLPSNLK